MILGVCDRRGNDVPAREVERVARAVSGDCQPVVWASPRVVLCALGQSKAPSGRIFTNESKTIALVVSGELYDLDGSVRARALPGETGKACLGQTLIRLYERGAGDFLASVNGKFAFALWDERQGRLVLGRDRLGIEPLFYSRNGSRFHFSSSVRPFLAGGWHEHRLDPQALLRYLLFCYNPGDATLVSGVQRLPAASRLSITDSGVSTNRYWHLSFAETEDKDEDEWREEILALIEDAIRARLDDREPGVLLSGGTDSSAIVSLTSRMVERPFRTFSFRCRGRSYDESPYARFVAERFGTDHTEIPYDPEALFSISRAVEAMDEPFCDAGIEIGTYLLGKTAQGGVPYVLSGEGGDELFGGHPVYTADKLAAVADLVPGPVLRPLAWLFQRIPDSDQKKNLQVKLKRFSYSLSFPRKLLSHRWRVHYTPAELRQLCTTDFLAQCDLERMYDPIFEYNSQADGNDQLSRSLYSDFFTLVSFYLRRLGLLRSFEVESRTPLLDHRLVECSARVPSRLKIRGLSDTKYVYRRILEGVVPHEILHDRPKLGHSVPMKNWLRESTSVKEWLYDTLSSSTFRERGLFRVNYIRRLLDEHVRKSRNHTHRLWGLMVLEAWLNEHWAAAASKELTERR